MRLYIEQSYLSVGSRANALAAFRIRLIDDDRRVATRDEFGIVSSADGARQMVHQLRQQGGADIVEIDFKDDPFKRARAAIGRLAEQGNHDQVDAVSLGRAGRTAAGIRHLPQECTDGTRKSSGKLRIATDGPESMTMTMAMTMSATGGATAMNLETSGKWLGADCGNVKPLILK